jgi:hypothetical protein
MQYEIKKINKNIFQKPIDKSKIFWYNKLGVKNKLYTIYEITYNLFANSD